jgi:hypothetical protein
MYYAPRIGASLYGMDFPPYLKVLTPKGTYLQLKYIMRPNSELMENNKMVICEGPSGCKRYLPDMAKDLVRIPRCICNHNTPAAKSLRSKDTKETRKTAAMIAKENKISTLHAMLGTPMACTCPRFAAGICPNNIKGMTCTGNHTLQGAWVDDPDPEVKKRICNIVCKLPRHSKNPAWCKNGKNCAYTHMYAPHAPVSLPPQYTPVYSPVFTPPWATQVKAPPRSPPTTSMGPEKDSSTC